MSPVIHDQVMIIDEWSAWRATVIAVIRKEYADLFPYLQHDEIDWDAWRPLYEQGHSAQAAVAQAMSVGVDVENKFE